MKLANLGGWTVAKPFGFNALGPTAEPGIRLLDYWTIGLLGCWAAAAFANSRTAYGLKPISAACLPDAVGPNAVNPVPFRAGLRSHSGIRQPHSLQFSDSYFAPATRENARQWDEFPLWCSTWRATITAVAEGKVMKCMYCQSEMARGHAPFPIDRKGIHVSFDNVPAWVCTQCGEAYFEETAVDAVQGIIKAVDEQTGKLARTA